VIFEKAVIAWLSWFCLGVLLEQGASVHGKWLYLDMLQLVTGPVLIGFRAILLGYALILSRKVLFNEK